MIRLSTFENNSFEPFKTLSKESYNSLQDDCTVIKNSYTQFVVFKFLQLNIKEYSKFINQWSDVPAYKMNFAIPTNIHFVLEANRLILNVIMGFKFFLDNAETYLKRNYGKESLIATDFIKLTNDCFDKSFAYRFLSKLRNYAIHLGFPLEVIHLDINFNHENPENSRHTFQFILHIEKLIAEKDLFGSIVYKDLLKLNEDFDLIPLINELTHYITIIQKYIYRVEGVTLNEAIDNIETFVGNRKTATNEIKVYEITESKERTHTLQVYDVPYDIITEFKNVYKNWY
ncbi:hypothetical protein [Flavobacterium pectinovorum]|uniref:Cthe-2314-like HEPN domain-containing protein n=1 Tax=Flavobacterium pectinovorum TaxID=29533 RepID=A0AB36P4T8_9FLAO|nr:hypothetical protein [Flavobacterium pectinovorum]OXB06262.1 hypothetical protein B0A72_09765 [Flavobacterium pectinovorum]SHM99637.1 hypothetical protein SAMN05444387_3731 [Flavobacterium pectinovorum]